MKKWIQYGLFGGVGGLAIGFITSLIFSAMAGTGHYYPSTPMFIEGFDTELGAVTMSALVWAIIGILSAVSQVVFEKIEGSLLKSTAIHFAIVYPTILVIGYFAGWFSGWEVLVPMTISFVIIYALVWIVSYFYYRNEVEKMNERLRVK